MNVIKEMIDDELINRIEFDNNRVHIEFNNGVDSDEIKNRFGSDYSNIEEIGKCNSGNWGIVICIANLKVSDFESLCNYSLTHQLVGNLKENRERINRDTLPKAFR